MISSQLIAMLKRVSQSFQTDTCTIEKRSTVTDDYGASTPVWEQVATGVDCRVITGYTFSVERSGETGGRTAMKDILRLVVPVGTGLQTDYRVTVGGNTYLVTALLTELTNEIDEQAVIVRTR